MQPRIGSTFVGVGIDAVGPAYNGAESLANITTNSGYAVMSVPPFVVAGLTEENHNATLFGRSNVSTNTLWVLGRASGPARSTVFVKTWG